MNESQIQIYNSNDGQTEIEVKLEKDTVWLSLSQLTDLFLRDKSVISRHITNIFKEKELDIKSVVAFFATTAADGNTYQVDYYNLDVIISVGYRIKSQRGTQFRIWANNILKEYLIKGYSINEKALRQQNEQLQELQKTIKILSSAVQSKELTTDESKGLLSIISDYSYALDILDQYDYQSLAITDTSGKDIYRISYAEAIDQINLVRKAYGNSELFGREKDESFKSSISTIYQTFDGKDLYPSIEEKAAHLLYFITKNHSFSDCNKRIAAFI
ncbi:MAG: cytochrome C biogenesis protein CycH [Bacteroidetes bacterium GWF2_40_14]|nr:MAG: cytochrome C biogenesis protein CycH [Bacteroidetes bacterium GWF2_40_14]